MKRVLEMNGVDDNNVNVLVPKNCTLNMVTMVNLS